MQFPKLPDWLIYAAIAGAILVVAQARREDANTPAPPPPVAGEAAVPLSPASPFDPAKVVDLSQTAGRAVATAFSIDARGLWLTSGDAIADCPRVVLVIAPGRGVVAKVSTQADGVAVLTTAGGGVPLAIGDVEPARGQRGFHPGFPHGAAGEASSRFIGPVTFQPRLRGEPERPARAWALTGRTEEMNGSLLGLAGAPVLDERGRVVGVTLADEVRRGVIRTTIVQSVRRSATSVAAMPATGLDQAVTPENYGLVSDVLRRGLSVVAVRCLG